MADPKQNDKQYGDDGRYSSTYLESASSSELLYELEQLRERRAGNERMLTTGWGTERFYRSSIESHISKQQGMILQLEMEISCRTRQ